VFVPPNAQNITYVAVNAVFIAQIAILPLKWRADVREQGAESTFCVREKPGSTAEMTQMQRIARSMPPLCNLCILLLYLLLF